MPRRSTGTVTAVVAAVAVFVILVRVYPGGSRAGRAIDDLSLVLAAGLACAAAGWRSRRAAGGAALSWALLAVAAGSWALGEGAWSYYELLADQATPFPSIADIGYLGFAGVAVVGVLLWPSTVLRGGARWRTLLDAVLVAGSLFILTWVTALGGAVRAGAASPLAWAVSVAYPVSDLILITLTVVILTHAQPGARAGLGLLAVGLGCLCVADSGFAYLTGLGRYATGSPVDAGWFGGFLLIAAAATMATAPDGERSAQGPALESTSRALLPYLPAGLGLSVALGGAFSGAGDQVALVAATLVMGALLLRQLLAVLDNRRLVNELVDAQHELKHQAFHDPLTGLANRALFGDRLRHGLELHSRDLRPLSLLYCDLDGFKHVNDTLGHEAGDEVIRACAERLRAVTRAADTVARMGGDEFAILLEQGDDAPAVVAHILAAFTQPTFIGSQSIALGISIGIAELHASAAPITAAAFLHRADAAMYHAKRSAKGFAITWSEDLTAEPYRPPLTPALLSTRERS